MPPKKKAPEPSKKVEQKKKEKIIEDKTFGLKNKKGAKTQKFIQHVQHQVKNAGQSAKKVEPLQSSLSKKEEKKKELEELNQIFRPVAVQKVEKGTDPKSVLCAFYKQGQCTKGDKCKFSHDLTLERKSEKKSVYVDMRDNEDNMENWDEEKLKEVVEKKHGERERKLPQTEIICRHFIDALELNKYGWFWDCPNGGDKCHYRHALPPGFVLNKDKKKHDKKDDITIEELVEIERAKLGFDLAKITLESFLAWKRRKIREREDKDQKENDRKRAEFKAGKNIGLSGREMFTFNPDLVNEEMMEEDEATYDYMPRENDEENGEIYVELTLENLIGKIEECDGTGTIVTERKFGFEPPLASGGSEEPVDDEIPIDEELFAAEDDLEALENELSSFKID